MEFAEQIMLDLINQGYSGNDLREHFKEEVSQIRPAMEAILAEAKLVAVSESGYASYGMFSMKWRNDGRNRKRLDNSR